MTVLDTRPSAKFQRHLPAGTYPINLDVNGRPCLVVGAGAVATRKIAGLAAAGAAVTVVATKVSNEVRSLADEPARADTVGAGSVVIEQRAYRRGEAASYRLVITAADDPAVNRRVFLDCEAAGVWCNSADDLDNCSFILPAIVRRDQVLVTVSSTGRSPAVASWLKRRIDDVLSPHIDRMVDAVVEARAQIRHEYGSTEAVDWAATLDRHGGRLLDLAANDAQDEAVQIVLQDLRSSVGAGFPSDADSDSHSGECEDGS